MITCTKSERVYFDSDVDSSLPSRSQQYLRAHFPGLSNLSQISGEEATVCTINSSPFKDFEAFMTKCSFVGGVVNRQIKGTECLDQPEIAVWAW
ncbi:5972_t:CDS:2, partial [Entrophospora sp. SA101]